MVDIFGDCESGGSAGKRGPAGEDGDDSLDICRWFPLETLIWLRNTAQCCYYFDKEDDFIQEGGKIVGFKSHSSRKNDAISLKDSVIKIRFGRGYCAEFVNSLLEISNTDLAMDLNSFTFLVITFKMTRIPNSEMIIVSNEKSDRGIFVNLKKFGIFGSDEEIFWKYKLKKWYTIAVQWTRKDDNKGYVYFKGKRADFTTTKPEAQSHSVFMGALKERKRLMPWTGCLALLEIYTYKSPSEDEFPAKFRDLIIEDHKRRILGA